MRRNQDDIEGEVNFHCIHCKVVSSWGLPTIPVADILSLSLSNRKCTFKSTCCVVQRFSGWLRERTE